MPSGHVRWFSPEKGFGYIRLPDGADVFFAEPAIRASDRGLITSGQNVEFDLQDGPLDSQAHDVRVLRPRDPKRQEVDADSAQTRTRPSR